MSQVDSIEHAIEQYQIALRVRSFETDPPGWASIQNRLAGMYVKRIRGNLADNLELALTHARQALRVYTRESDPEGWGMVQHNLGAIYCNRRHGHREDNLELAIKHLQLASQVRTREADPARWAMTQYSLGDLYFRRIRGEEADNLELALMHTERALKVYTRETEPDGWVRVQNGLANIYGDRLRGNQAANLEKAIDLFSQTLAVWTHEVNPEGWAMINHNLGLIYRKRLNGNRKDNLDMAIKHLQLALQVRTREANPSDWAATAFQLGSLFGDRLHGSQAENCEKAIDLFSQALTVWTHEANAEGWAMIQHNLAVAYVNRVCGKRQENVEQAREHYEQALRVFTLENFSARYQQTRRNIGDLYFTEGTWAFALAAYQEAIRAEQLLLAGAYTEAGRQAEVAKTAVLYARSAYAQLKLGKTGEALTQLEKGRTRLLSQALALKDVDMSLLPSLEQRALQRFRQTIQTLEAEMRVLPETLKWDEERIQVRALNQARTQLQEAIARIRTTHPDFMPEGLDQPEILALIPPGGALVAPVITPQGSAVFVVPSGLQEVSLKHILWLDGFKEVDLQSLLRGQTEEIGLGGWLGAYLNAPNERQTWHDTIETAGQIQWTQLIAPIAERLATLEVTQVLLMPQGGLGLLPLHAAWHEDEGRRRYFLDDYTVTYVPSAYAHKVSLERMNDTQRHGRSLLAIINPTSDLKYATAEGEQVASLFEKDKTTLLPNTDATVKTVMERGSAGYVHFSCHGFYRWDDPMQSGLVLANHETLTLAKIIGHFNLENTRLVTLSACETGITDIRQSPDEYLGLPAGFLQAGAPAVVSTLWAVNDLSTMLLMERFYQLHLKEGQDLPVALRHAQIWLREVTAGELAKRFADAEDALLSSTRMSIRTASDYFTRFTKLDPKEQPFAHPYYWAAFTFTGS